MIFSRRVAPHVILLPTKIGAHSKAHVVAEVRGVVGA